MCDLILRVVHVSKSVLSGDIEMIMLWMKIAGCFPPFCSCLFVCGHYCVTSSGMCLHSSSLSHVTFEVDIK